MNKNYIALSSESEDRLKQFIRGSILGDGYLSKIPINGRNSRISFGHGSKQYEYLMWKHQFLASLCLQGTVSKYTAKSDRYKTGECVTYTTRSCVHPLFTYYRGLYYIDNKKAVNKEDIQFLDEFGLAIWYMDDGNISRPKGNKRPYIELNTQSFQATEVEFLTKLISDKWGIKCARMSYSNIIRISVYDCEKFLSLIEPYKITCLEYKWVLNKEDELSGSPNV